MAEQKEVMPNTQLKLLYDNIQENNPNLIYVDKAFAAVANISLVAASVKKKTVDTIDYFPIEKHNHEVYTNTINSYRNERARYAMQKLGESIVYENGIYCGEVPFTMDVVGPKHTPKTYAMKMIFIQETDNYSIVLVTTTVLERIHVIMHELLQKQMPQGMCGTVALCRALKLPVPLPSPSASSAKKVVLFSSGSWLSAFTEKLMNEHLRKTTLSQVLTVAHPPQLVFTLTINGYNIRCCMRNGGLKPPASAEEPKTKLYYHLYLELD